MSTLSRKGWSRSWSVAAILLILIAALTIVLLDRIGRSEEGVKGKRRSGAVLAEVVRAPAGRPVSAPPVPSSGFAPQVRLG